MSRDDKRRFSKIYRRVWNDARFRALSAALPNGQTLFLRLLSGPELTNIPGLFSIGEGALAEALGWNLSDFRRVFAEVEAQGLAKANWEARVVYIPKALQYNVPESPNVVRSWRQAWDELPECDIKREAYQQFQAFLEGLSEGFQRAFVEACPDPGPKVSPKSAKPESSPLFQAFGEGLERPSADLPPGVALDPSTRCSIHNSGTPGDGGKSESFQLFQAFGEGSHKPSRNQEQEQEKEKEKKEDHSHRTVGEEPSGSGARLQALTPTHAASPVPKVKDPVSRKGTRMTAGWQPGAATLAWAAQQGIVNPLGPLDEFRDHWLAVPGARGVKLSWEATYRNRLRYLLENGRIDTAVTVPGPSRRAETPEPKRTPEEAAALSERLDRIAKTITQKVVVR